MWSLAAIGSMLTLCVGPADQASTRTVPPTGSVLLFSFFRGDGEDGLYLAWSRDGLAWFEINPSSRSFLAPAIGGKLMRDPCLRLGPDGMFRLTWTTGWGQPPVIGYASSRDLIHWSDQRALPVMSHEPTARNAWAPELFYDRKARTWLVFWSSTIPGKFPETDGAGDAGFNHRIYYTTTHDFDTFTPTKLLYDGGFNVIDAMLLEAQGRFHLIVKDETLRPVRKNLRIAVGEHPDGPFGPASAPFTGDWVEGPSAIRIGGRYYVYFDHYAAPQYYGAMRSRDLKTWEDVSTRLTMPSGARHGAVLRVPASVIAPLLSGRNR